MNKWQKIINNNTIRFLNYDDDLPLENNVHPAISSFAIDDALASTIGAHESQSPTTVRLWIHDKTVVLGIPDTRLPHIKDGIKYVKEQGFTPIIRNSGGLAVALDKGVLNISLIFPNERTTSIHSSYDLMLNFITDIFKPYTNAVRAYEIVGSYCPGDYDLSIDGIKFAGISQRRVKNGISVQIYIDICGDSSLRAKLVQQFYNVSRKNEPTNYEYPDVNPDVMGSLSELLKKDITVNEIIDQIKIVLIDTKSHIIYAQFSETEHDIYKKRLEQMIKRNKPV